VNGAWKPDAIWTQGPGVDPLPRYEIALPPVTATRDASAPATPISTEMPPSTVQDVVEKKIDRDAASPPTNETSVPVKRILIIAVCPTDVSFLRLDREVRDICNVLWKAKKVRFVIEVRWAVRVKDLGRAILEFEPHIIHFCGHGSEEGGIVLEDEMGKSHKVNPQALAGLFELFTDSIEGVVESVFLNACYMENQADAMSPYVKYIIGTRGVLVDVDAINFSAAFYEALANGRSYEFAYEYALQIAKAQGTVADISSVMRKNEQAGRTQAKRDRNDEHKNQGAGTRVLFLAASPANAARLRLGKEIREISDVLRDALQQREFLIQQRWGARFDDLHQSLFDFKPQIVHFTGHGSEDGLVFDDEKGEGQVIGADLLCKLFDLFSSRIDCVVLNASYSDNIARELSANVGCVIGISGAVQDEAAIAFATGFYRALAAKLSFEDAFKSGCLQFDQRTKQKIGQYTFHRAENS
jgi:CHAT domain